MRHHKRPGKLGRTSTHRISMLKNMATSLFLHERICTTHAKAKVLRPYAEKLITLAKRGDLHARRQAASVVRDDEVLKKLFSEIAERYNTRPGGYTRILKVGERKGDRSETAFIELVDGNFAKGEPAKAESEASA